MKEDTNLLPQELVFLILKLADTSTVHECKQVLAFACDRNPRLKDLPAAGNDPRR